MPPGDSLGRDYRRLPLGRKEEDCHAQKRRRDKKITPIYIGVIFLFHEFHYFFEYRWLVFGEMGEDFAIKLYLLLF